MWIIFAFKFRKIFSADEVQVKMEDLKKSLYKTCSRYIDIVEDKIKELKSVTAETDRKIEAYRAELSRTVNTSFQKTIETVNAKGKGRNKVQPLPESPAPEKGKASRGNASLLSRYEKNRKQGDLFSSAPEPAIKAEEENGQTVVTVPIVQPEFFAAENQIKDKKSFSQQVKELHLKGYTEEEIASELKRSIQEVKFSLEIS